MSRYCFVTKKKQMFGNNVSHANNKTQKIFAPNIHKFSFFSEILKKSFSLSVSNHGMRTIEHRGGLDNYLLNTASSDLNKAAKKIKSLIEKAKQTDLSENK